MRDFQAQRIATYVWAKEDTVILPLWNYFPYLFKEEKIQIEQCEINKQLIINKERMRAYADFANMRTEEGE